MSCAQQCNQGRACTCRPEGDDEGAEPMSVFEQVTVGAVVAASCALLVALAGFLVGVLPW